MLRNWLWIALGLVATGAMFIFAAWMDLRNDAEQIRRNKAAEDMLRRGAKR